MFKRYNEGKYFIEILHNGDKYYYLDSSGQLHREDGPAVEKLNGDKFWYLNGKLHRDDGPAVEKVSGYKFWYLNGKIIKEGK